MARRALGIAVVIAIGIQLGGTAFARERQSPVAARHVSIRIVTRATEVNDFVDTGVAGPSAGDLYVFEDQLFKTTTSTKPIGTASGECALIDVKTLRYQCTTVSRLPAGDIVTGGILELKVGAVSTGPILGGTGRYRNARGEAKLTLGPLEGPHEVTYSVILGP